MYHPECELSGYSAHAPLMSTLYGILEASLKIGASLHSQELNGTFKLHSYAQQIHAQTVVSYQLLFLPNP